MALIQVTQSGKSNLIIFIHGFIGGRETWIRQDGRKSILDYLKEDIRINSEYDFAVFEYYTEFIDKIDKAKGLVSSLFGGKKNPSKNISIENIAQMLKTEIKYLPERIEKLVIIAHSMGGLVAKSMIIENIIEKSDRQISLYVSLAVPHRGSNLATFGKLIFGNPQLEDLQPLGDKIHKMNEQWLQLSKKLPKTLYFQAKYDDIVPNIATVSFDKRKIEVDYTDDDHIGIVRPKHKDDVVLKALKFHLVNNLKVTNKEQKKSNKKIAPEALLSKLYPKIEQAIAMYSLISWHNYEPKTIQVKEDSEWGGRQFALDYPDLLDYSNKPTLFDLFLETENRYFPIDGVESIVRKMTNTEDYWYQFKIESLFGYELNIEVNPSPNVYKGLYELKSKIELDSDCMKELSIYSNAEEICKFTVYPLRIYNLPASNEFTILVSNGYLDWYSDGTINRIDEWVFYYEEGQYFTSGNLKKLIQILLRKLQITENELEIAIPLLESKWYNLSETNINSVISELNRNDELSKFSNFLTN
ncbi:MAG: hypothetical protein IBJ16_01100 [Chitinophagaceae bacterium]|nr:hypothetical protein [Chitinophagaceae bacterium]